MSVFDVTCIDTGGKYGVALVLVVNRKAVIAANLGSATLVRNGETVMCVKGVGIDGFLGIVYSVAICKTLAIVALKNSFGHAPVGFAMFEFISIAAVLMG